MKKKNILNILLGSTLETQSQDQLPTQCQQMVLQDACFLYNIVLLCPAIFEKQRIFVMSAVKQC